MNIVDEIIQILEREARTPEGAQFEPVLNAISALMGTNLDEPLARWYQEYVVQICIGGKLRVEADNLKWMRPFDIAAAPEVAALLPTKDGYVLVSRYWACPNEHILPVEGTSVHFGSAARRRFLHDMEVLAENGRVHPYARGFPHWHVGEVSGTIVLDSWSALRSPSRDERDELFATIDKLLAQ